jgi:SWIM zinc finger
MSPPAKQQQPGGGLTHRHQQEQQHLHHQHHDTSQPPPENRQRLFRKKITRNVLMRIRKAQQQQMYLVSTEKFADPSAADPSASLPLPLDQHHPAHSDMDDLHRRPCHTTTTFVVLGTTGNVYHVNIDRLSRCSCPDFQSKGLHCKHIFFVLLKVLRVPLHSFLLYQDAWLTSELQSMFTNFRDTTFAVGQQPSTAAPMAAELVQQIYKEEAQKRLYSVKHKRILQEYLNFATHQNPPSAPTCRRTTPGGDNL